MDAHEQSVEEALLEIERKAKSCVACGLANHRTNVVFADGNPRSPLVIVGEGPGENEDLQGLPFVGRAGQLLDKALIAAGMARKHVYICNVVKCRAANLENGKWRNRPPLPDEIQACNPWLDAQLTLIQPLVVVCLGAPAASTVIQRNFRITQDRGKWFSCKWSPAAIAAFHPAYILRNGGEAYEATYGLLVQDLKAARAKVIELKKLKDQQQPILPVSETDPQMSLF
ncbi:MAG: uracil-DNA glycosylase [Fimbriimonadia bacterium]|nr:uracil-DNA glycosylase [Fimbriimonadia bacterium]